jgi:signal transduction histidine kinase
MSARMRPLPIHLWLGAALVALVALPVLAAGATAVTLSLWQGGQRQAAREHLVAARRVVVRPEGRWDDPAWQASVRTRLAALGVDAQVFQAGRLVFVTPRVFPSAQFKQDPTHGLLVRTGTAGAVAALYTPGPQVEPLVAALVAWLVTVVLTLAGAGWTLRRLVVRPLAAMSQAAQKIAVGQFDVQLPSSSVREVAEVTAALEIMGAGLRAAEQRQVALEQERRLFIGSIVHDLRTPVFALRGYLRGLEAGLAATPEMIREYAAECRAKADALERLIGDLFTYTRLEYLEQTPQRAPLELGALLHQTVVDMQPVAETKEIIVAVDGPSAPCPLVGDGHLLARAVQNVLDNALRHTPAGGRVCVRWWQEGALLVLTIADTGPGLAAADLPHLFTPLYRGDPSRNRHTGGAGLGLTIARRILQAHGGSIVAANRDGGGAIFTVTLLADDSPAPRAASVAPLHRSEHGGA